MLLAIDVGNTNVTLGIFSDSRLVKSWRLETRGTLSADDYGIKLRDLFHYGGIQEKTIKVVALASVVPPLTKAFEELSKKYFKVDCWTIEPGNSGVKILSDNPKEVGADRIVNVAAAQELFGGPAIILDFGTATTFDCCSKKGEYLGGVIAPGPALAAEGLAARTAQLPLVNMARPKRVLGRNTVECIQSGLFYGYLGLVEEILRRLIKEMGGQPNVIATGGLAVLIAPETKLIQKVVPDLTLQGIRILYEKRRTVK